MRRAERQAGFTLVEVVVALAIVAVGFLAVFKTINETANNVDYLRERTFAAWVADNQLAEIRLRPEIPSVDESEGEVEFAGRRWHWRAVVSQTPVEGLRRVDVEVRRDGDAEGSFLLKQAGFVGATMAAAAPSPTPWRGNPGGGGNPPDDGEE